MLRETQTSICNKALALIGEDPINSMDDNSMLAARACKSQYDLNFHTVLEAAPWTFTLTEAKLVRVDYPPYSKEQKSVYAIPADCAHIIRVYIRHQRKMARSTADWDIRYIPDLADKFIICNRPMPPKPKEDEEEIKPEPYSETLWIEYVKDDEKLDLYSADFINCLVAGLASKICMPITKDLERTSTMVQYYNSLLADAIRKNMNEVGEERLHWKDPITASRG